MSSSKFSKSLRLSIQWKTAILSGVMILSVGIVSTFYFSTHAEDIIDRYHQKGLHSVASTFAFNTEYGILIRDGVALDIIAKGMKRDEEILFGFVFDRNWKSLSSKPSGLSSSQYQAIKKVMRSVVPEKLIEPWSQRVPSLKGLEDVLLTVAPVYSEKSRGAKEVGLFGEDALTVREQIGYIAIISSLKQIKKEIEMVRNGIQFVIAILFLVLFILTFILTRFFIFAIRKLLHGIHRVGSGDLSARVEIQSSDEMQELAEGFNQMAIELEKTTVSRDALVNEINERKAVQQQLIQAQKMEGIGRLAGGVAHDFNNILTVIMGYSQSLLSSFEVNDPREQDIKEINDAARRAADLTRQLLAYSRRQIVVPKVINLNDLITNMTKMLKRLIGDSVTLSTVTSSELNAVKADPGQVEQVIVNLAVNARDAMPNGGDLKIETVNFKVDKEYIEKRAGMKLGDYVLLSIKDTGVGMSQEVQERIFEPFFTTKEQGKGTGLGLATCYGIVKQAEGYIEVDSQDGQGTTFNVYLPKCNEPLDSLLQENQSPPKEKGVGTILVVEDEEVVRSLAMRFLSRQGYDVIEAQDGEAALSLVEKNKEKNIDLILTDLSMPKMGGKELAQKLKRTHPKIKVIFMSGYVHDPLEPEEIFLQKPFSWSELIGKVKQALEV